MDSNIQTMLTTGMPTLAVLTGILVNNSRLSDLRSELQNLRADMNIRFDGMDRRFDDMKELWRSEPHRVEEILDARL